MNNLANLLTVLSLFCGFASLIFSLESHFTLASWSIILSVIFDGLDGQIAKRLYRPTEFGEELDSLVDVVAFGIAPSILGYIFVYREFHFWATLSLFIYLCSSVMRLAKYNVTPKEQLKYYFYGLPTTMSGGVLASFILLYRTYIKSPPHFIFLLLVLALSFLMTSQIRYLNLDGLRKIFGRKGILILVIALALVIFRPEITIFTIFILYLIFSPFLVRKIMYNIAH